MKRNPRVIIAIALCSFLLPLVVSGNTSALRGSEEDLLKIALMDGMRTCYVKGDSYVKSSGITKGLFATNSYDAMLGHDARDDHIVILPTQISNTIKDFDLSCREAFEGYSGGGGTTRGINDLFGKFTTPDEYGYVFDTEKNQPEEGGDTSGLSTIELTMSVKDGSNTNNKPTSSTGKLTCSGELVSKGKRWLTKTCSGEAKLTYSSGGVELYLSLTGGGERGVGLSSSALQLEFIDPWIGWSFDDRTDRYMFANVNDSYKQSMESADVIDKVKKNIRITFNSAYASPEPTVTISEVKAQQPGDKPQITDNSYYRHINKDPYDTDADFV